MRKKSKLNQLIEVSSKLIHKKGFKATTMRAIAAEMGYEVTNIYNYIESKNELLDTIISDLKEYFLQDLEDIANSNFDPLDKIKQIVSLVCQTSYRRPYAFSIVLNEWRHLDTEGKRQFLKDRNKCLSTLANILEEGMNLNLIKRGNSRIISSMVLSQSFWIYNVYTYHGEEKVNPIELERQMSSIFLEGLMKD